MKKYHLTSILSIILLIAVYFPAHGMITFTSENGLSNSCIRTLMQDSHKNVWITTYNGLNRFDGSKINVYRHVEGDASSLNHNLCNVMLETAEKMLLVGTETGVQRYDYNTDSFTTLPLLKSSGDTIQAHVVTLLQRNDGTVLTTTADEGVFALHGEVFEQIELWEPNLRAVFMLEDHKGRLWVTDVTGNIYVGGIPVDCHSDIVGMCEGASGTIYLGLIRGGMLRFDEESKTFVQATEGTSIISAVRATKDGRILICTDGNGLQIYDERTGNVSRSDIRTYDYDFAMSNVKDALVDCYGNLWVGVYWKGVIVQPADMSPFMYMGRLSALRNTIGTNSVTALAADKQADEGKALWVGTDHEGLWHVTDNGMESIHYRPGEKGCMPSTIMSICESSQGDLWLGSSFEGLFRMNRATGVCTPLTALAEGAEDIRDAFDLTEDGYGNLWIATNGNGLFRLWKEGSRYRTEHYTTMVDNAAIYPHQILVNRYLSCLLVHGDCLYVGTSNDLEIFTLNEGTLRIREQLLPRAGVRDMCMGNNGTLWVAANDGLYNVDVSGTKATVIGRYTTAEGLGDDRVNAVLMDSNGLLWAGTDHGLTCMETATGRMANFTTDDGLQYNEFGLRTALATGGQVYFGGTGGLTSFRTGNVGLQTASATTTGDLCIVDLWLNGKAVHTDTRSGNHFVTEAIIPETKEIHLSQADHTFSLELSHMNACHTRHNYTYSIDGSTPVALSQGQNHLNFTGMPKGQHRLVISDTGTDQMRTLLIHIHPVWYGSTPALLAYALLILTTLGLVLFIRRQHRVARQKEEEHRVEVERVQTEHRQEVERVRNFSRVEELDVASPDDLLMQRVMKVVNDNLSNPDMNVEFIADHVGVSRVHFYRRLKEITNMTPHDFLKGIRLKEAARLLAEKKYDITDVSIATGFRSLSTFSSSFKSYYGVTPTEYIKNGAPEGEG